jgi:hypothetical protein
MKRSEAESGRVCSATIWEGRKRSRSVFKPSLEGLLFKNGVKLDNLLIQMVLILVFLEYFNIKE